MIVSIHQPNFIPWAGYFYKIIQSDIFVLLDDVQFTKNSYQNRNRIKTARGAAWLTVPVLTKGHFQELMNEILINNDVEWRKKHWRTIVENYNRSPYLALYREYFADLYSQEWISLVDLNEAIIRHLATELGLETEIIKSSQLDVKGSGTERLIRICQALGGDTYLSGHGGKKYLDERLFGEEEIDLTYYDFAPPVYPQGYGHFIPGLSIIDLIFNCGEKSLDIILGGKGQCRR